MQPAHHWQFHSAVHLIMVVIHMGLSLAFILAPADRFSSSSWDPLLDVINGSIEPWGIVLGLAGLLMAKGGLWLDMLGEAIAICWFSMMSALFLYALKDPTASATGFIVYAGLMAVNGALLAQRVIDWMKLRAPTRR